MQVSSLPDAHCREDWGLIEALLTKAVEGTRTYDPAVDVVWIAYEDGILFGAATTRLRADGDAELRLAAGTRFRDWIGLLDEAVTGWARACSSPRIVMRGRKGWARYSRAFGWDALGTDDENKSMFEKAL